MWVFLRHSWASGSSPLNVIPFQISCGEPIVEIRKELAVWTPEIEKTGAQPLPFESYSRGILQTPPFFKHSVSICKQALHLRNANHPTLTPEMVSHWYHRMNTDSKIFWQFNRLTIILQKSLKQWVAKILIAILFARPQTTGGKQFGGGSGANPPPGP